MIRELTSEAVQSGARVEKACEVLGVSARALQRWSKSPEDLRAGPKDKPSNSLSPKERANVLQVSTNSEFRDCSPKCIVPRLANRGEYVGSESTFYRILREENMLHRRGPQKAPTAKPREYVANGPWQVASWDITYLKSNVHGRFHYLYLVIDIWSRKILGWSIHEQELDTHASQLIEQIRSDAPLEVDLNGWVLHSDNGGPMKGATMSATLKRLGVVPSFSRPRVSNDNPYSEAMFKTLKYRPEYPRVFESIGAAHAWVSQFVNWYNTEHLHSGIGYVSPSERHDGKDLQILQKRREVYEAARQRNPERWSRNTRKWSRPDTVYLNPEIGEMRRSKTA